MHEIASLYIAKRYFVLDAVRGLRYSRRGSLTSLLREDANTPHLNPLPYTTTASRRLGSPQGERRGNPTSRYGAGPLDNASCGKTGTRKTWFLRNEPTDFGGTISWS